MKSENISTIKNTNIRNSTLDIHASDVLVFLDRIHMYDHYIIYRYHYYYGIIDYKNRIGIWVNPNSEIKLSKIDITLAFEIKLLKQIYFRQL
jgi:hypothetical protein